MKKQNKAINLHLDGLYDQERSHLNRLFLNCAYLQVLDFLTTIAFLLHGVKEANPLVIFFVRIAGNPVAGILIAKVIGVLIASYCWRFRRTRILTRINFFFALLVTWNLVALILGSM